MKIALKALLNGRVHGLVFVTLCLVLGGLLVAALQITWDIQRLSDKLLQGESSSLSISQS